MEQTLDAFVDGETVDTADLDAALASPDGRAYLIDALALRRLLQGASAPSAQIPAHRRQLDSYARAAIIAIGLLGAGYAAGARARPVTIIERPVPSAIADQAPEPTRVIELTPGVNWYESKGGD